MQAYRYYKNNEYSHWHFADGTLAAKLKVQRYLKNVMNALREARLAYYQTEPHGQLYKDLYALHFKIHKRRGYEVHELVIKHNKEIIECLEN